MANINIPEWTPDQVVDWMSGLGNKMTPYLTLFKEKQVNGARLLILRCDDLEYLGIHVIGHQELLLEAIEHLRNFHYELQRENLQQLALRLSVAATSLVNELQTHHDGSKVETQTLSDVTCVVAAVKPLVCWLDRSTGDVVERKSALLQLALEAATCAQRDRFAESPARAVAAAAATLARLADFLVQDFQDPMLLQPASLISASWQQGSKPLGFFVLPSFCGHHQVTDIRFGSPAHAAGLIEEGDEIVQVGERCVVGWSGAAVSAACGAALRLAVAVRRRGTQRPPAPPPAPAPARRLQPWRLHDLHHFQMELGQLRAEAEAERAAGAVASAAASLAAGAEAEADGDGDESDDSEPLSPPASPSHLVLDTRMYPPPPRAPPQRRYSVSGGSPRTVRHHLSMHQFWQELRNQSFKHTGSAQMSNNEDLSNSLYRRDKSVSYSTGLEMSPRPKTYIGVGMKHPSPSIKGHPSNDESDNDSGHSPNKSRGKLDKSHSTPAYDFGQSSNDEPGSLVTQIIPESPSTPTDSPTILVHSAEKADQILDFKKYSSQIGEAILQQQHKHKVHDEKTKFSFTEHTETKDLDRNNEKILETINIAMLERQNKDDKKIATKQSSFRLQTTFNENGQTTTTKTFSVSEHVKTIQNEIVQAINEQRISNPRLSKVTEMSDVPPEPPPRPLFTQKPYLKEPLLPVKDARIKDYPPLKPVKQLDTPEHNSPLKPIKHGESLQISLPLKHITKHDIQLIPNDKRELLPLNYDSNLNSSQVDIAKTSTKISTTNVTSNPDLVSSVNSSLSESQSLQMALSPVPKVAMSPPASVVRNIFPSKSKSLKKKNSLLVKRRKLPVWEVTGVVWRGDVQQRVRPRAPSHSSNSSPSSHSPHSPHSHPHPHSSPSPHSHSHSHSPPCRWARRLLLLREDALLAYTHHQSTKAECLIFLNGFTVAPAPEVKSRPFAFKVYHTGTAFYFAAPSDHERALWLHHLARAVSSTGSFAQGDESNNFSETEYSEEEHSDKEVDRKEKDKEKEKEKDKDKSKFGSLKKLTHRMQRSESQENVAHASTSLDRKYLRFFSRHKNKEDTKSSKNKHSAAPVPTEHYRIYRRVTPSQYTHTEQSQATHNVAKIKKIDPITDQNAQDVSKAQKKIPKPINYIHASNPNLLDFEKSDFVTKPPLQVPVAAKPKTRKPENFVGFMTLEEFMLKEQEQERQIQYSSRVQMGIEKDAKEDRANSKKAAKELQQQWERIIPDVIYGELPTYNEDQIPLPVLEQIQSRSLPKTPDKPERSAPEKICSDAKPISVKGKDGYEKIVYTVDKSPLKDLEKEPPKVLPRKPFKSSPDLSSKSRTPSAKDLGYEVIYDEKDTSDERERTRRKSKDYETVYGKERRLSDDVPPKIMPKSKQVLNRQNSLNRNSGVDTSPVFVQGESPEKFWLNSLRRNDRVHQRKASEERGKALKSATQYTPVALPVSSGTGLATAPHLQNSLDLNPTSSGSPGRAGISRLRHVFGGGASRQEEEVDDWCLRVFPNDATQYPHLQCPPTFQPETYSLSSFRPPPKDKTPPDP